MEVTLRENLGARRLIAGWLLLALTALAMSTVYAVLVVITRTPLLNGFGIARELFRNSLVLHVNFAVIVWLLVCAAGLWTLAAGGVGSWRKAALLMAAVGALGMAVTPLLGTSEALLSNYVPVLDSRIFLAGLTCFATGIVLCAAASVGDITRRLRAGQWAIWRVGALLSIVIMVFVVGSLVVSLAAGMPDSQAGFDTLFWGPGHLLQFVHVVLMMAVWCVLGERILGSPVASLRWLTGLLVLATLPVLAAPFIHASYTVGSLEYRQAFTALMTWGAWPAATILGSLLVLKLLRMGRSVWAKPEMFPLAISLLLFTLGCVFGAAINGETTLVTAHYHGTVGAVAIAYMGLGYWLLPAFGFTAVNRLARWQLAIYGSGLLMLASSLAWLGSMGVPRKTPHVDQAAQTVASMSAMGLMGLGGLLSLVGIALFVFAIARSIWPRKQKIALRKNSRDVRGRALLLTAGATIAMGLLISLLPGKYYNSVPNTDVEIQLADTSPPAEMMGEAPVTGESLAWSESTGRELNSPGLNGGEKIAKTKDGKNALDPYAAHAQKKGNAEIEQRFNQGVVMLHAKRYDDAITAFHRVLLLDPDMPEANVNMGFALLGLNRYSAARDFFESAIAVRTDQINAYYGLALALTGMQDTALALGAMRTYRHLAPRDDPYREKVEQLTKEWEEKLDQQRNEQRPAMK